MRYVNKIFSLLLLAVILMHTGFSSTVFYASETNSQITDVYSEGTSEIINIEGVTYTYEYYYVNGNRAIDITDNSTDITQTLIYDEANESIFLDNQQVATVSENKSDIPIVLATNGWESIGSGSKTITWAEGTAAGIIIDMIATVIGIRSSHVKTALAGDVISNLVHAATGCTVYYDLQMYSALFVTTQYRYEWSLLDTTGGYHGPYYTHVYF